ncbi:von Hippel-Lindau disease tumor suppressor-like [Gigantopelta aegis]|uniref:von Hippel-Lindau disease tumor suppressor-like n=1 Tax=Gigantopelta aegis TaxID=1735272 RepID=UPI001B8897D5|nr:von Hippel-Lindau disease tumor suppressor-like [Gigantopelta aegis]
MPSLPVLKSLNYETKVNVIFKNETKRDIDLYWIGYDGMYVRYARNLRTDRIYNVFTFETHPWVARDSNTGAVIHFNKTCSVFIPVANEDCLPVIVPLNIPVYTLKEISVQALCRMCVSEVDNLELPEELKDKLREKRTLNCDKEYTPR